MCIYYNIHMELRYKKKFFEKSYVRFPVKLNDLFE